MKGLSIIHLERIKGKLKKDAHQRLQAEVYTAQVIFLIECKLSYLGYF